MSKATGLGKQMRRKISWLHQQMAAATATSGVEPLPVFNRRTGQFTLIFVPDHLMKVWSMRRVRQGLIVIFVMLLAYTVYKGFDQKAAEQNPLQITRYRRKL